MLLFDEYLVLTPAESQHSCLLYCAGIQSKLQYMGLCCSADFDIGEVRQCFDSFQTVMERKKSGGRRERETGKGVGVGGCDKEGIWAAQCHAREDCRENTRGWGRLEGQAYQRVCEDRGEQVGCMSHNRMEK